MSASENDKSISDKSHYYPWIINVHNDFTERYLGSVERLIKAFFICNGGGLVAVLSYWRVEQPHSCLLTASLLLFTTGLLLSLVLVGVDFLVCDTALQGYTNKSREYMDNKLDIEGLKSFLDLGSDHCLARLLHPLGWLSGIFFAVGTGIGISAFISIAAY